MVRRPRRGEHRYVGGLAWPLIAVQSPDLIKDVACEHQDQDDDDREEVENQRLDAVHHKIPAAIHDSGVGATPLLTATHLPHALDSARSLKH